MDDQPEDDSNDTTSEEDDDEEEKALLKRVDELEGQIASNKFLYDAHVEVIDIYRKLGDLNSLREAYKRFHSLFPLTPKLWLEWIKDEMKIAQTPEEKKKIFELFDDAVEDYLSIDLWVEYAQYSIGIGDLDTTRSIINRGLVVGGLHVKDGSLLWDTLRELENAHISHYLEGSEEWKAQVLRLADVFKRQLSVPLFGMESTYDEFQEWVKKLPEGLVDVKPIEWSYNKTKKLLKKYQEFEEKLDAAEDDASLHEIYKSYINSIKDPSTVICLYERAVLPLCLFPDLWWDYCMYTLQLGETAVKVSGRALRNCPWSEELWIVRLKILEHHSKGESEILSCFEQGLTSISPNPGLQLWLTYLSYVHTSKQDQNILEKLFEQALEQFNISNDSSSLLRRFYIKTLVSKGDTVKARNVWNGIMKHPNNKASAMMWMQYINFELQFGEQKHIRPLFKRALSEKTDWPQYIADEWLMYERLNGTSLDVLKCSEKVKSVLEAQKVAFQQRQENDEDGKLPTRKRKNEGNTTFTTKKTKIDSNSSSNVKKPELVIKRIDKNPKTTVFVSNLHNSATESKLQELFPNAVAIEIVRDRAGKSRNYGYIQFKTEEEVMVALARDRVPLEGRPVFISEIKVDKTERKPTFKYPTTFEANKLFVRGLPLSKSKEDLMEIFKPYNPKDVRLVTKKSGQLKGIAYVEFETEEAAQKALKATDQMKIDDEHTISVAISAPPPPKKTPINPIQNIQAEPIRHARSRLQLLVPRSVQIKSASANGDTKPKSNADFRDLLVKK